LGDCERNESFAHADFVREQRSPEIANGVEQSRNGGYLMWMQPYLAHWLGGSRLNVAQIQGRDQRFYSI
jgi:hypothetical protein